MPTKRTGNPRGRPPGAKNKPKNIEEFIFLHSVSRPPIPAPKPKVKRGGWYTGKTPEERSEYAKKLAARRVAVGYETKPRPEYRGRPPELTGEQYVKWKAQVAPEIKRILKKMAKDGTLPEDDAGNQVLTKSLATFLTVTNTKDIVSLGRLILDFTKAKPAQKVDITTRTHEDFLDELAAEEGLDDPK